MPEWKPEILRRLASLNLAPAREAEIAEELAQHLEDRYQELLASGKTDDQAFRTTIEELKSNDLLARSLKSVEKEKYREPILSGEATRSFFAGVVQDVRYGLRMLRKNSGFAATAILTLALGIGATTAIFSVVDGVMLKPLPFPTADRLVRIGSVFVANGRGGVASYPDFLDWRARNHVFDGMAVSRTNDFTLIGPREPLHLQGAVASAQLFSLLGAAPALGRSFLPKEDQPAAANGTDPVILSYGLWQREFGSDASVLGRAIQIGDQPFTVVGVMPQGFQFPIQADPVELWTTIGVDAAGGANAMTAQRGAHYLDVDGLLKPGVTLEQAQAEMATIASVLNKEHPENKPRTVRIMPELRGLIGPLRTPLLVLLGAVGFVLLIVCVNVANLLLARATARHKEMAVRAVLGATRRRTVCQLLTESVSLGLLGGGLGLALALASLRLLLRLIPVDVPRLNAVGLDARLLTFSILISLLAGMLFGLAPAMRASKVSLTESLKESGQGSKGKERSRLRDALVVSEVTLAVVLLVGAGLLIQSFLHLTRVDPGFDPHHVLTFQLDSPAGMQDSRGPAFFREVVTRLSAVPGVSSASAVASLPLTGDNIASSIEIEGEPTPMGSRPTADFNAVEPNYFRTLRIALVAGRDFTERDDSKSTPVVIVNRTLARRFFPNQNPIGKHVRPGIGNGYGPGESPMREIVGVIGDVKQSGLDTEAAPEVYAPLAQSPFGTMLIVVRTANDPRSIVGAARREVTSLDKNAPIYHVETLDQYFAESVAEPRFLTLLLSGFAGLALLLASLGIYGVISYIVAQSTREIGIRMALGAEAGEVVFAVLRRGLLLAVVGATIGLAGAFGLVHLLPGLLYGVRATDPMTLAAAPLVLLMVAAIASYIPARRAARVDPMVALRYE
jgi:putative ABC transport system permease protein